eukprot:10873896-Karenia_brevis.AAC.1
MEKESNHQSQPTQFIPWATAFNDRCKSGGIVNEPNETFTLEVVSKRENCNNHCSGFSIRDV